MTQTTEERELEHELTIDASSYGHTDIVQQIASDAAAASLKSYENGEHGDLLLNAGRAALIATNAALRALDAAGHLVPEGSVCVQTWFVMSADAEIVAGPLEASAFENYMLRVGLADGQYVDTIRVIRSTIPRKDTMPQPAAQPTNVGEAEF